jgi:hypothetical protein
MFFGCIKVFGTSGIVSSDRLVRTLPQSVMNAEGHSTAFALGILAGTGDVVWFAPPA